MNNEYLDKYEATVKEAVCAFLRAKNEIDERLPEAMDCSVLNKLTVVPSKGNTLWQTRQNR